MGNRRPQCEHPATCWQQLPESAGTSANFLPINMPYWLYWPYYRACITSPHPKGVLLHTITKCNWHL
jgi:hypothetical protein